MQHIPPLTHFDVADILIAMDMRREGDKMENTTRDTMTTREAADYLGISQRQVQRLVKQGKILSTPQGKLYHVIPRDALEAYKAERDSHTQPADIPAACRILEAGGEILGSMDQGGQAYPVWALLSPGRIPELDRLLLCKGTPDEIYVPQAARTKLGSCYTYTIAIRHPEGTTGHKRRG